MTGYSIWRHLIPAAAGLAMLGGVFLTAGMAEAAGPKGQAWRGSHHGSHHGSHWKGQAWQGSHHGFHHRGPRVVDTPPNKVFIPRHVFRPVPVYPSYPVYPAYPAYSYPSYSYAPSYGYAPARQWVPGYWAYAWVPAAADGGTWVNGYYDTDGVWVAGYYRAANGQTAQAGQYQPYWVEGHWTP